MSRESEFEQGVRELVDERIAQLRRSPFRVISALPEVEGEEQLVAGRKCKLTVYRQGLENTEILVMVQLTCPTLAGLATLHNERGLVFSATGNVREATSDELLKNGG